MLGFISKLFGGSKSEKDIKKVQPLIAEINKNYESYHSISNDELRKKTADFRNRINEYVKATSDLIDQNKEAVENPDIDLQSKEAIYTEIEKLKKQKDEQIEEILKEILPEAFAVIKEASKRMAENSTLESSVMPLDEHLVTYTSKKYIRIENGKTYFDNHWQAAGQDVTWNMVHYDVQLIGGTVLHEGKIAEMATGEGKTLVSTLPTYLNALPGLGVHVVTVNDYLAKRDSEWNGPLYEWLGLKVDCIDKHQPNTNARRNAYKADIVYGTNNEFGFDYLRDNMVHDPSEMVQGKHHFAIVDEVDSVLIDDARTPLIISGPIPKGEDQNFHVLKPRIEKLVEAQKRIVNQSLIEAKKLIKEGKSDKETGGLALYRAFRGLPKNGALIKFLSEDGNRQILQKSENYYIGEQQRNMPIVNEGLFFYIDEKQNTVDLTDKGLEMITSNNEDKDFFVLPDIATGLAEIEKSNHSTEEKAQLKDKLVNQYAVKADLIHSLQQLLKAYTLFEKDTEYVVIDDKVKIVDEQTGRIMEGRRYSDGLHQALEAKENVHIEAATQTFATITLQNYFRMYHKLGGMTGTAETEAGEFWEIYKLDVVKIPTNKPIGRNDQQDLVYKTKREKFKAVIDEIEILRGQNRPVLVGTTSVEYSELISRMLQQKKIPHNVLNAKQHAREAQIVTEAGQMGAVTIATNMAGRGTDIKLGEGVKEAGGLAIIGTERHESRRVDRQLRGRAGRQGDPGSSQFFVSLEDELMRLFGSERIASLMDKMGHKEGEVLQHGMISKSIERAQRKVEENNFGIRKRLLEYDDVMNSQRDVVYKRRKHALFGEQVSIDLDNALYDVCQDLVRVGRETGDFENYKIDTIKALGIESTLTSDDLSKETAGDKLYQEASAHYLNKKQVLVENMLPQLQEILIQSEGKVQNISVPFTDGIKGITILCNLKETIERKGAPIFDALEKNITLAIIDDGWKEHLRAMDDLRQSVQMASYEQKDPLLIYKFEAFELFKKMLLETNTNITSFLFRCGIPVQQDQNIEELNFDEYDYQELEDNSKQISEAGSDYAADEHDYYIDPINNKAPGQKKK